MPSHYINTYLRESKTEAEKSHPEWLRRFFESFHSELLKNLKKGSSQGDRTVLPKAFSLSLECLLPPGVGCHSENKPLKDFLRPGTSEDLSALLKSKRIDFLLEKDAKRIFIEFKTNLNFNDLAAAMVEMAVVKKFLPKQKHDHYFTGSLHLFPSQPNVAGLRELNESLGKPLGFISVLCTREQKFDIGAIKKFRDDVETILAT